jgi:hypothetical protein
MELTLPHSARKVAPLETIIRRAGVATFSPRTENFPMNIETQWTVYRTRFLVRARQLTEPLVFTDALGREQSGRPGDYLVESLEGIRRITTQALFEDIYVPLAQNNRSDSGAPAGGPARPISRASPEDRARAIA